MSTGEIPQSIDVPSKSGGFVAQEHARLTITWRKPHVEIAPHLEAIVERALLVAGDCALAYPRPSGDWMAPKPRPKIMAYVRKVAKETSNAHVSLATLDDARSFALEYAAFLPGWIDGTFGRSPRGRDSYLQVTFPRAQLYERSKEMGTWFAELAALVPFSAATLGLALEGHYREVYPRALEHRALDISDVSCVSHDIGNAVHGIGWLTALGDDVVNRLGGESNLAQTLGPAASVTKLSGAWSSRSDTNRHGAAPKTSSRLIAGSLGSSATSSTSPDPSATSPALSPMARRATKDARKRCRRRGIDAS